MSTPRQQAREALGLRLRELRQDGRLPQRRLATLAGWHESKVSKIEHGKQTPSEDDIRTWCRLVGAEEHVPDLIATVRNISSAYMEWRREWRAGAHRRQQTIAAQEAETRLFRVFEPIVIPGLLQTREYAEQRFRDNIAFHGTGGDVTDAVNARMERQEILRRGDRDRRFHMVMCEVALTIGLADDDVLVEQLERLLTLSILPRLSLGIIPTRARHRRAPNHGFWVFDERLVLVDTAAAELAIIQPREIAVYLQEFEYLASSAVYGAAARDLINAAIQTVRAS
ncbi:helix-turn-helix domain-containing protein [Actinomadura livida]|uniref:Helix-turn-helix transcriptional regulator n=1 Tax=Actinomadura livida TaxID=79909 RepID=A0A7W7I7D4_9ACTN|nr:MULTISPECIES: helix-turn-helix transcriptional regulator [Actinomadura]MBB4771896.1 transcriptional regulator with XRE-family HTH domain [Actinomadura catellatispora]GGU03215.1 transcriptional regulator [Actinomadura livida]